MAEDMREFRHPDLLRMDRSGLIVIDMQEAFRPVIDRFDEVALAPRGDLVDRLVDLLDLR